MHEEAIALLRFDAERIFLSAAKTYDMMGETEEAEISRTHATRLLEAAQALENDKLTGQQKPEKGKAL